MRIGPAEIKLVDDKFTMQLEVFSQVSLDFESKQLKKKQGTKIGKLGLLLTRLSWHPEAFLVKPFSQPRGDH